MKVLHLTLKKKWFDMIASGEKKEEYREIKEFWSKRFMGPDWFKFDLGFLAAQIQNYYAYTHFLNSK